MLGELAGLLRTGSVVHKLLQAYRPEQPQEQEAFWQKWALQALSSVAHVAGGVFLRLQCFFEGLPWSMFKLLNGPDSQQAVSEADQMWRTPDCCKDQYFSKRLFAKMGGAVPMEGAVAPNAKGALAANAAYTRVTEHRQHRSYL